MRRSPALLLALAWLSSPAAAQDALPACQEQHELEQVIASGGDLIPDGCRNITVTEVETDEARLCVIDFSAEDDGVLQQLRDAAIPEQWWVRCDALAGAAQ